MDWKIIKMISRLTDDMNWWGFQDYSPYDTLRDIESKTRAQVEQELYDLAGDVRAGKTNSYFIRNFKLKPDEIDWLINNTPTAVVEITADLIGAAENYREEYDRKLARDPRFKARERGRWESIDYHRDDSFSNGDIVMIRTGFVGSNGGPYRLSNVNNFKGTAWVGDLEEDMGWYYDFSALQKVNEKMTPGEAQADIEKWREKKKKIDQLLLKRRPPRGGASSVE